MPGSPAELCSVSGPVVDSGLNYALHPYGLPPTPQPFTYWGINTGSTLAELEANCLPTGFSVTYSGDSRFRGFHP